MKPSTTLILYGSVVASSIILAIVQIFAIFYFCQSSHLWIIQRRYPRIVIVEAIVLVLALLVTIPSMLNDEILTLCHEWNRTDHGEVGGETCETVHDSLSIIHIVSEATI